MELVFQSDAENDACYIALSLGALKGGAVANSVRADDDVTLDFDSEGRLIGVDIMNASKRLPAGYEAPRGTEQIIGVKEAAEMAGVQRSNFVRDLASREDFPTPLAELATGRIWLRSEVERYVSARRGRQTPKPSPSKRRSA